MRETDFKRTDLGVIPKEWQILTLGDLGEPVMCKRILKEQTTSTGDIPFFKIGTFGGRPDAYISKDLYDLMRSQYFFPNKGDILISAAGTIGRLVIYDGKPSYFQDSNIVWINHSQEKIINPFLYYWLNEYKWDAETSCTISRLYNATIKAAKIIVPSLKEQKLISKTLQDIDELISGLKNLIEKKRAIKAGAMSQLLSGKLRLPGFSEPWISTSLDELGDFFKGRGISREEANSGEMPAIRYGEIYTDHNNYIHHFKSYISREVAERSFLLQNGDLCFTASGETLEEIGKTVAFASDEIAYAGGDIIILRPTKEINPIFFGFLLNTPPVVKQKSLKGHGVSIMHIRAKALAEIQVSYPSDLEEQKEIAKVLTDMDEEISALEAKLKKYEQLKKGMMQQLLTGKIRLVSPNESLS